MRQPTEAEPDDTRYPTSLRPGVMLTGVDGDRSILASTSGVCVVNPAGEKFVTCASHGFAGGDGLVYHPNMRGNHIGTVATTFPLTDISLFKLDPTVKYARETFSNEDSTAEAFRRLKDPTTLRYAERISLITPFNGLCEGTYVATETRKIPADEPGEGYQYIRSEVVFFDPAAGRLMDGCCGAPLFAEDFEVVGQVRFVGNDGLHIWASSYECLQKDGYELSEIVEGIELAFGNISMYLESHIVDPQTTSQDASDQCHKERGVIGGYCSVHHPLFVHAHHE